jgi:LPXTG-motif cell wall-anchored protein
MMRKLFILIAAAVATCGFWAPEANAASTSITITSTGCSGGATFCFSPGNVTVHDGDSATWTNMSAAPHTVTPCSPAVCAGNSAGTGTDASFTSANVAPGATFTHTFHGPGTYLYYCQIHGYAVMHGTITVLAAQQPAPAPAPNPQTTAHPTTGIASATPTAGATPTATTSPRALAHTGANTALWMIAAGILVAIGAATVLATRRRAHTPHG